MPTKNIIIDRHMFNTTNQKATESISSYVACCCWLPTPMTLASGWESDVPACGLPAIFSVHLLSCAVTPAESVHKSRGDNVVRMCVQLKR